MDGSETEYCKTRLDQRDSYVGISWQPSQYTKWNNKTLSGSQDIGQGWYKTFKVDLFGGYFECKLEKNL